MPQHKYIMDKAGFNKLRQVQKLLLVMESGHLVMERKEPNRLQKLYVYQQFYVEVIYDIKRNKVLAIETPEMGKIVDDYLATLSIDDLLNL